jgi:hypothetical protein
MGLKTLGVLISVAFLGVLSTKADAPDNTLKKADGRMYCEANPGQPACHGQSNPNHHI